MVLTVLAAVMISCTSDKKDEPTPPPVPPIEDNTEMLKFAEKTEYGAYKGDASLFVFDKPTCQLGFNTTKHSFRLQTDTQTKFFSLDLATAPVADAELKAVLESSGDISLVDGEITVKVLKVEELKVWLWNNAAKQGFIIRLK